MIRPVGWLDNERVLDQAVTGIEKGDSMIRFDYESHLSIKKADFYYSNDTVSINEKRKWESLPAMIFDDRIESENPREGFAMGFLYMTDIMDLGYSGISSK